MHHQGRLFPSQKADSAVDFQKDWQCISLDAKLSGKHNPSTLLKPTVKRTIEKVHSRLKKKEKRKSSLSKSRASQVAQMVKNLPAMQKTWVQSLGREDPPGEGNGNPLQYSCLENTMDKRA